MREKTKDVVEPTEAGAWKQVNSQRYTFWIVAFIMTHSIELEGARFEMQHKNEFCGDLSFLGTYSYHFGSGPEKSAQKCFDTDQKTFSVK